MYTYVDVIHIRTYAYVYIFLKTTCVHICLARWEQQVSRVDAADQAWMRNFGMSLILLYASAFHRRVVVPLEKYCYQDAGLQPYHYQCICVFYVALFLK